MVGLWTFVLRLDEIGPTVTSTWHFLVNFCGFATMGVLVMGLGFACRGFRFCLPWEVVIVDFFFGAEFYLVMIFHKPHGGGWVLMWVRENVGFGGCSRLWGGF